MHGASFEQTARTRCRMRPTREPTATEFRDLADTMAPLAWMADADGCDLLVQPALARLHRPVVRRHARAGAGPACIIPTTSSACSPASARASRRALEWEDTFPLRRHDGAWRWFLSRALPQRDAAGIVQRWFGTNTDVTEQYAAEDRLRQSEARFRTLVDAVRGDHLDRRSGRADVERRNRAGPTFTGQAADEYSGWGWLQALDPRDRARTRPRPGRSAVEACHALPGRASHVRRADGAMRVMEARAVPVRDEADGAIREWVGVHTDITARRAAEDALQTARDAAEAANRAKSQFIANMSHELRTPLSAVIGYSEMLAEEIADLGQPELLGDLGKIEGSARHLLGLINDVLDLSKIEAGRMTVSAVDFDLPALLRDVVSQARPLAAKKNNTLVLRHATPRPWRCIPTTPRSASACSTSWATPRSSPSTARSSSSAATARCATARRWWC